MRNMKFAKRIGAVVLAVCMVLSCAGCGGSSNKGASEETTEVTTEGGNSKILVAAASSLQATFDNELIPLSRNNGRRNICKFWRFTAAD